MNPETKITLLKGDPKDDLDDMLDRARGAMAERQVTLAAVVIVHEFDGLEAVEMFMPEQNRLRTVGALIEAASLLHYSPAESD